MKIERRINETNLDITPSFPGHQTLGSSASHLGKGLHHTILVTRNFIGFCFHSTIIEKETNTYIYRHLMPNLNGLRLPGH